jgi:uncharacterized membrane protein YphA (DoxX/SURF4 family)
MAGAMRTVWHVGRFGLAIVFLWAGIAKLLDLWAFVQAVERYQIVHGVLAKMIAFTLPWLEVLAGICMVAQRWVRGAMLLAAMMFCMFLAALILAKARGLDISCGCFGTGKSATLNFAIVRAAVLFALLGVTGYALRVASRQNATGGSGDRALLPRGDQSADSTDAAANSAEQAGLP